MSCTFGRTHWDHSDSKKAWWLRVPIIPSQEEGVLDLGLPHYPQVLDEASSIIQSAGFSYGGGQRQAAKVQGSLFYGSHLEGSLLKLCIATCPPSVLANRLGLYKDRLLFIFLCLTWIVWLTQHIVLLSTRSLNSSNSISNSNNSSSILWIHIYWISGPAFVCFFLQFQGCPTL